MATGKVVNQTPVYYGPSKTMYPSENSYAGPNDNVTIFWEENGFYYIQYPSGTSQKRMYIETKAVTSIVGSVQSWNAELLSRFVKPQDSQTVTTYTGPSKSGYTTAGSVSYGEEVKYLKDKKENGYALIEYSVSGGKKKRAWIDAMNLVVNMPASTFYSYTQNGWTISSPWRNKGSVKYPGHLGVDYVKTLGTKFRAIADGVVAGKSASCLDNNGYTIVLKHEVGGKSFYSFYAHMDDPAPFNVGDVVKAGQEIQKYGKSGNVTAEHVHIGVYTGGLNVDQFGYYKVNNENADFEDNGTGRISYKGYVFYNAEQVISSNGSIIQ